MAALVLVFFTGTAFAAPPPPTVTMQGQAAVITGTSSSQLRLQVSGTGNTGWLLEVSLNPLAITTDSSGNPVITVSGPFTLGIPQTPIASGTANGAVSNNSGSGDIKLTDSASATSLDMTFTIAPDGSVTAQTQGVWPVVPAAQPAVTQTATSQPVNHVFWYISRTAAIGAYILLFVNVCLGLLMKSQFMERTLGRWRALDLHQFTALMAVALLGLHVFSLLGDKYSNFTLVQLLIPFASSYLVVWTALGVIGFYLVLVVTFSAYVRKHIGYKTWRALHFSAMALFVVSLLHAIMAGTDSSAMWMQWIYVITGTTVTYLCFWRFLGYRATERAGRVAGTAAVSVRS